MKRQTEILIAGSSLVIAILISLLMYHILSPKNTSQTMQEHQNPLVKEVLVASRDIHVGEPIAGAVVYEKWPASPNRSDFLKRTDIEGEKAQTLIANRSIAKGEPITNIAVVDRKTGSALAARLKPNMRAATITVDPTAISGGLIAPGDIVDVLVSENNTTQTVLCAVLVLALDQRTDRTETPKSNTVPRTATLEVTPEQAHTIASFPKSSVISLSLHSTGDAGTEKCQIAQEKQQGRSIKIIRG